MSVYVHVLNRAEEPAGAAIKLFTYSPLSAVDAFQRATWNQMGLMPLEDLAAPFQRAAVPVALTILIDKPSSEFTVLAGFVQKPGKDSVTQISRPYSGTFVRVYHMKQNISKFASANADLLARSAGFTPRMMRAFHEVDLRAGISHVVLEAVTAGPYAWMSYGGIPRLKGKFAQEVKARWAKMNALGLTPLDQSVGTWVNSLHAESNDNDFRHLFRIETSLSARQTLKALFFGDSRFLKNPRGYRFQRGNTQRVPFNDLIDFGITLQTQDSDFQKHFHARVEHSIAHAPKPSLLERLRLRFQI